MRLKVVFIVSLVLLMSLAWNCQRANAQSFGVELHNTLMPVSGAMGGTSIAQPLDLQSAINGNPATLRQFPGTQFSFGAAWVEPTFNLRHDGGAIPDVGAFSAKSEAEGLAIPNIGVTQDFSALGRPVTLGIAFLTGAGGSVNFVGVPNSNGTSSLLEIFEVATALGVDLTDRLSVGAPVMLGVGVLNAPFVGISSGTYDYALRGSIGFGYDVNCHTKLGLYYQTQQEFNFDNAILLDLGGGNFSRPFDVNLGLPDNIGLGISHDGLLDSRLLLAADVLYKQWDNASLFDVIYKNQWVLQAGAQYKYSQRIRLRLGYVYAENPIRSLPSGAAGGVPAQGALNGLNYIQAQYAIINGHRVSAGIGVHDVLPGVDLDLFAGGMFRESQDFGTLTSVNVESYWVGAGLTWRFGRGACERLPIPDDWGCDYDN